MIYLDNAATTLFKPRGVRRNMDYALGHFGSPGRGGYSFSMNAAEAAYNCREAAAKLFHISEPERVVFTSNATHGLNIAINTFAGPGKRAVVSGYEHNAVIRPLYASGTTVDVASSELFDQEDAVASFEKKLNEKTDFVVLNHVSNVFGYILPVQRIANLCREKRIPFILDASQSAGSLDVDMGRLGASFIAMPGHKGLYGPQGTGILLCGDCVKPFMHGGSGSNSLLTEMPPFLPDMLEAGTHNMPGIAGLKAGLDFIQKYGTKNIFAYEKLLTDTMAEGLRSVPGVTVYASERIDSQGGVVSFDVQGFSAEEAGELLAKMGVAVRAGLHCAPLAHKTAGTLAKGTVRASVSTFSRKSDVDVLIESVGRLVRTRR